MQEIFGVTTHGKMMREIQEAGKAGWELVTTQALWKEEAGGGVTVTAFLKRPLLEFRKWTTVDDKFTVIARYRGITNLNFTTLERKDDGEQINIPLEKLSTGDQAYIKDILA